MPGRVVWVDAILRSTFAAGYDRNLLYLGYQNSKSSLHISCAKESRRTATRMSSAFFGLSACAERVKATYAEIGAAFRFVEVLRSNMGGE